MAWEVLKFSRTAVNRAGQVLIDPDSGVEVVDASLEVLSNWRSAHAFPLNTITTDLRQKAERTSPDPIVVQRLKRARSILAKLRRERGMQLSRMQDIGGCRVVMPTVQKVRILRGHFSKSRALHELVNEYDYIASPKVTGYRGIHLVYRFQSRSKEEYNKLLIEIQLRTNLQHTWATAVETVGAVLGQALKASEGEEPWLEFFRLASAAFAIKERQNPVPGVPGSAFEIAIALRKSLNSLHVRDKLDAYRTALRQTAASRVKDAAYYLLILRPDVRLLEIHAFSTRNLDVAYREYLKYEKQLPLFAAVEQLSLFPALDDYSQAQAVLVGADSLRSLRQSYPNYYLDTDKFLAEVEAFVRKHGRATA